MYRCRGLPPPPMPLCRFGDVAGCRGRRTRQWPVCRHIVQSSGEHLGNVLCRLPLPFPPVPLPPAHAPRTSRPRACVAVLCFPLLTRPSQVALTNLLPSAAEQHVPSVLCPVRTRTPPFACNPCCPPLTPVEGQAQGFPHRHCPIPSPGRHLRGPFTTHCLSLSMPQPRCRTGTSLFPMHKQERWTATWRRPARPSAPLSSPKAASCAQCFRLPYLARTPCRLSAQDHPRPGLPNVGAMAWELSAPLCEDTPCCPFAGLEHLAALLLITARRIGEASHPGPRDSFFALGCINPTGLNGKYAVTSGLEAGVYGVSETHLTDRGIQSFRKGSFSVQSPFKLHHGATVRARPGSTFSGEYTGVGFLGSFPARTAPCAWPDGLHETGRIHVVNFFIQPIWVLCGVAYGFPTCPHKTAFLLESLTQRVVIEGVGPRVICGDFNLEPQQVPQAAFWRTKGFIEVQDLQQRLTGRSPAVTCKGKTRKDFCWISPELQSLFVEACVDETFFADHSVVFARLRTPSANVPRFSWRMPTGHAPNRTPPMPASPPPPKHSARLRGPVRPAL